MGGAERSWDAAYLRHLPALVSILALIVLPGTASADRLAVLEFSGDGSLTDKELMYLVDTVRAEALNILPTDPWEIVTHENMIVVLETNAESLQCREGECEVETGRLIGADWVVSGAVIEFGTKYRVTLKLFETERGRLLASALIDESTLDALAEEIRLACVDLFAVGAGDQSPRRDTFVHGGVDVVDGTFGGRHVVEFATDPPGAAVVVGGAFLCTTPCSKALEEGRHRLSLDLTRYETVERSLDVDGPTRVSETMPPQFAWLTVTSEPTGLDVQLDGLSVGSTPISLMEVAPGEHFVQIDDPAWFPDGRTVVTTKAAEERVDLVARPRCGLLQVEARDRAGNDLAVQVEIDGLVEGVTPLTRKLQVGHHDIAVCVEPHPRGCRRALESHPAVVFERTTAVVVDPQTGDVQESLIPIFGAIQAVVSLETSTSAAIPDVVANAVWDEVTFELQCDEAAIRADQIAIKKSGATPLTRVFSSDRLQVRECEFSFLLREKRTSSFHRVTPGASSRKEVSLQVRLPSVRLSRLEPGDKAWLVPGDDPARSESIQGGGPGVATRGGPYSVVVLHRGHRCVVAASGQHTEDVTIDPYGTLVLPPDQAGGQRILHITPVSGVPTGARTVRREYETAESILLPAGTWTVALEAEGYHPYEETVEVRRGETVQVAPQPMDVTLVFTNLPEDSVVEVQTARRHVVMREDRSEARGPVHAGVADFKITAPDHVPMSGTVSIPPGALEQSVPVQLSLTEPARVRLAAKRRTTGLGLVSASFAVTGFAVLGVHGFVDTRATTAREDYLAMGSDHTPEDIATAGTKAMDLEADSHGLGVAGGLLLGTAGIAAIATVLSALHGRQQVGSVEIAIQPRLDGAYLGLTGEW